MERKTKTGMAVLIIGMVLVGFYTINARKEFAVQFMNSCSANHECAVVSASFCGGATAINKNYAEAWQRHLDEERESNKDVVCKPSLPLDFFRAKCVNNKCEAVQIRNE